MKYKAVIFDLFGTLVPSLPLEEHQTAMGQIASVLSVPSEDLIPLWMDTSYQREIGAFPNKETNFEYICSKLKVSVRQTKIKMAAQMSRATTKQLMEPRPGPIEVIVKIKSEGYKTGVITNCASDVPDIWGTNPMASLIDITLFSCLVGLAKPDPNIYLLAAEWLGINSEESLFIDDNPEFLEGAAEVGMIPILVQVPTQEKSNPYRNTVEEWNGPTISSLREVLDILG